MKAITSIAREDGYSFVFDGTNADDLLDYRPGLRALGEEGIRSPLAEARLTKEEIRALARVAGLEVADRPSNTCLLTRFPHDTEIKPADLRKAGELRLKFTLNNLFNAEYENNAYGGMWTEDGNEKTWAYYFPQAGINWMAGISLTF